MSVARMTYFALNNDQSVHSPQFEKLEERSQ